MFNDMRPSDQTLVQFKPARAKKKIIIDELAENHQTSDLWEQKIDGERYLIQTNRPTHDNKYLHGVTSRRESVIHGRFVEKTDRVPHIATAPINGQNILDSEFVSSGDLRLIDFPGRLWDKLQNRTHPHMAWLLDTYQGALPIYPHVSNTVSIMGSLGSEAIRKQEERGLIWAYCFDLIQYLGQNATTAPQLKRRTLLANMLASLNPADGIILMPQWSNLTLAEVEEFFYLVTDVPRGETDGGEGLIRKLQDKPYNHAQAWWKLKKDYPADVFYTGRSKTGEHGITGQMLGLAASLEIAVYHKGLACPIGWVSGIRDGHHRLETPEQHALRAFEPIEVRHNGLQEDPTSPCGYTLRHPRWRRDRSNDKNAVDCTFAILKAEVQRVGAD